jgi:rhamnulokinase
MKKAPTFLAFDLGAESGRAVLGCLDSGRLKIKEIHRFPNGPIQEESSLHWDVARLWTEMKQSLAFTLREPKGNLVSLGVDTWGVDFALLDAEDSLISNPFNYRDRRTEGMVEAACAILPRDQIYSQTGIQIMPINSLFQLFSMVKSGRSQLEKARRFLNIPDLFNFWFSGIKASEFTITTTTQCYNPKTNQWALGMLKEMGIPTDIFGEIIQPGTVLGKLHADISNGVDTSKVNIVAIASHDTQSAIAAVPAMTDDFLYLSSGTWSLMGAEIEQPIINNDSFMNDLTNEGGYGGKFCFLKNIVGLWLLQECRRFWAKNGQYYSYDDLTHLAETATAFKAFVNPADPIFLSPGKMAERIQNFCKLNHQPVPETNGEIVRCILESLALEYRLVSDQISRLLKRELPVIHIIGGGSRNTLLNQFTASATGRTVIAGPVEATAIGNILVQAITVGEISNLGEGREIISASFENSIYEPNSISLWNEAYQKYLSLKMEVE